MPFADIPFVDLALPDASASLAVQKACESQGVFYVRNHGIPQDTLDTAFRAAKSFFCLPLSAKMGTFLGEGAVRGYQPFGCQRVDPGRQTEYGDQKEGFLFGLEPPGEDLDPEQRQPLHAPNVWPGSDNLPEFRPAMESFWAHSTAACQRIVSLMSLALGLDRDHLLPQFTPGMPILHPLRYAAAPSRPDEGLFGIGAHTDYGAVTLVATQGPGLQVRKRQEGAEWQDVAEKEGALVVYLGDTMERWTNGKWRAALHRVVIPEAEGGERHSITYFLKPNAYSSLGCLPSFTWEDSPPRWPEVTFAEHLFSALTPTYVT